MIERDALTDNDWIDTFRKYWRNIDYDLGSAIGWIPGLRPVGVGTPINTSVIAVFEPLVLLQLPDSNNVLIFHTFSIVSSVGTFKL